MYDMRFINAKNCQGKLYRDKKTGDLVQYCIHNFIIYPVFQMVDELHANFIIQNKNQFVRFEGVCTFCGEGITIFAEDVFENEKSQNKFVEELLKENKDEKNRKTKKG